MYLSLYDSLNYNSYNFWVSFCFDHIIEDFTGLGLQKSLLDIDPSPTNQIRSDAGGIMNKSILI